MKKKKNYVVRINQNSVAPSQHLLNLKKINTKKKVVASPDLILPKNKLKDNLENLFIVDFLKILYKILFFIPRSIVKYIIFVYKLVYNIFKNKFIFKKVKNIDKDKEKDILRKQIQKENESGYLNDSKLSFKNFVIEPPHYWKRALSTFVVLAFIFVLPIKVFSSFEELQDQKADIIGKSFEGYNELIKSNYREANSSFALAKESINNLGFLLNHLLRAIPKVGQQFTAGNGLLAFGQNISQAAFLLDEAVNYFDEDIGLMGKVEYLKTKINEALPRLLLASSVLEKLDNSGILPIDINPLKQALFQGTRALIVFNDFSDTLLDILGKDHFKRYLFIFQNNNELRPTGGFIGSFAVLDIDKGEIKKLDIPGGGSYDIQGQLKESVISPEPFHLINSRWEFQDSNWFPDFPTTAKKIMWFYEKAGGPSVDGVVAIDASFMEELLGFVGSINMPKYGRIIDKDNFIDETQKIVELEYDKTENKPKQFIADMAPILINRLMNIKKDNFKYFSKLIHKAILEKDLLVYSKDKEVQNSLASFGLSGKLKNISGFTDYLMLVDTNIAGQKTDGKIIRNIDHLSTIEDDGSIVDTVTITRRHNGIKGTLFSGVRNVTYMRLYVPEGSELLEASGFREPPAELFESPFDSYILDEDLARIQGPVFVDPKSSTRINNEFNRTVFGNWIMVDPGEEVQLTLKYRLPYKINLTNTKSFKNKLVGVLDLNNKFITYKMLVEKQPGAKNTTFKSRVILNTAKTVARVGPDLALQDDGWQIEKALDKDLYYGVVLER